MDCVVTLCIKVLALVVDIFGGYLLSNCHYDVLKTVFNYDVHCNFSGGCKVKSNSTLFKPFGIIRVHLAETF